MEELLDFPPSFLNENRTALGVRSVTGTFEKRAPAEPFFDLIIRAFNYMGEGGGGGGGGAGGFGLCQDKIYLVPP